MNRKFYLWIGSATMLVIASLAGCSGGKGDRDEHANKQTKIEVSPSGIAGFVESLKGKYVPLFRGVNGEYSNISISVDKGGVLYHCNTQTQADKDLKSCLESLTNSTGYSLVAPGYVERPLVPVTIGGKIFCQSAQSVDAPSFFSMHQICVAKSDMNGTVAIPGSDISWKYSIPSGMPFYMLGQVDKDVENLLIYSFSGIVPKDAGATSSEQAVAPSAEVHARESSQAESAYEDSGSQECVEVSRKYIAMQRRYDAGTLPAFDIAEMAQLQNFRGVLYGCKGGESREEKEYLVQHPKPSTGQPHTPEAESTDQMPVSTTSDASYDYLPPDPSGNFAVGIERIFASVDMANQMIKRLRRLNLPAYNEFAQHNGRDINVVIVGPFADRSIAESARQRVKEGTGNDAQLFEFGAGKVQVERDRFDEEKRQLEEEKRQLQAQRDALEQDKLDANQRREMCENYRVVMEGQIRQGGATPANLEEGLRQRGCANDGQSQSAGSTTPAAGGYVQIEFIGRDPPPPFTFRAASDDTNRVKGASAGIRFTGVNLPCGMYRLMVDKPQDAGGGVARDTDLCKASDFMILPGEIYTLRNRSNSDLVSKNVRGQ